MSTSAITFKHVWFTYKSQSEPTLKNINLTINQGEKIIIVGQSGSGKSTLGQCINGLIPFSYEGKLEGTLSIMGKETQNKSLFDISKKVGTVLQDPDSQFVGLTVGEDIAFSLENDCIQPKIMKEKVLKAATQVNIQDHLHKSIHHLSGGQKQRVSLAGVLVDDVDILLFDEPLANLDPASGKEAIALINQIHQQTQKTIIIIEHRLEEVLDQTVDRIIVMDDGEITANMTPDELLGSQILIDSQIREPLYLKALKYAGLTLTESDRPSHLDSLPLIHIQQKVLDWIKQPVTLKINQKKELILEVNQLAFHYPSQPLILENLSIRLYKGDMISIVGANGAGKSTLSKLLCGYLKAQSGTIRYDNQDVTSHSVKRRAEKVGMVLQNPNDMISKPMIMEEVALGLRLRGENPEVISKKVEEVLVLCGLYSYRNWPITALSFGQKKRVAIASILVLNPNILILDEPTAGQDLKHYTELMDFLAMLNSKGITIVLITHDMHVMLEYTSRAIVMKDGEILADTNTLELMSDIDLIQAASLSQTSLYSLAEKLNVNPRLLVNRFIHADKGARNSVSHAYLS